MNWFDPASRELGVWLLQPEQIIQQLLRKVNVNVIIDVFLILSSEITRGHHQCNSIVSILFT